MLIKIKRAKGPNGKVVECVHYSSNYQFKDLKEYLISSSNIMKVFKNPNQNGIWIKYNNCMVFQVSLDSVFVRDNRDAVTYCSHDIFKKKYQVIVQD